MKRYLAIALTLLMSASIYSQDLILTNSGDSLNCKITKTKPDYIYFTIKHNNQILNTLIPVSDVKEHQFAYYQTSEVPLDKIVGYDDFQHFRIAISGGYSNHVAKISEDVPDDFKNYIKELQSGYHFTGEATYFFSKTFGIGLKYNVFKSTNSMDDIYVTDPDGYTRYGSMSDNMTITFVSPVFTARFMNKAKTNAFITGISMGYLGYSDQKVIVDSYKLTGSTIGLVYDIGYDIGLSEKVSLGFQLSYLTGALTEMYWDNGTTIETIKFDQDNYESLNRIDLSVGLRFGL